MSNKLGLIGSWFRICASGFGLGVDRLTMLLLGIPIKEVMFLFRGPNRLTP